jgi:3-oxocholest-4-en-26-oyl-CoA dehydrogenase alpha subunit
MIKETPEQRALRDEVRSYLASFMTPEVRSQIIQGGDSSPLYLELIRKMGHDGWLGVALPPEYGGRGLGPVEHYIFFREIRRAGAPFNPVTINTVAPALIAMGTPAQRAQYLPKIVAGELQVAIGYTEPEAGTDLASLRTTAVRDGDHYVVNGQKVFTSRAQAADYIWLACRTDGTAAKHKGISILMVPTAAEGYSCTPTPTLGFTTTTTFYDNVRVPAENLVGAENGGWRVIMSQLNHERLAVPALIGLTDRLWEEVRDWCLQTASATGRRPIDEPWVRSELARTKARLDAARLLNWQMANRMARGEPAPADSSTAKVFGTETMMDVYRSLLNIVGPLAALPSGAPGAFLVGELEFAAREAQLYTFGGGTNEIQREIIAWRGLSVRRETAGVR